MLYLMKPKNKVRQTPKLKAVPNPDIIINLGQLNHLRFEKSNEEYIVTLIDDFGFESLKGYGASPIEAINDLHQTLI